MRRPFPTPLLFPHAGLFLLALALLVGCGPTESGKTLPNLLLVSFDTTRADALGCYGNELGASPVVDRLAAEGVVFERAFSPVPVTLPSHTTMFTGLDPPRHTVRDNAVYHVPDEALTLAEYLGEHGYSTFAVVASIVLLDDYRISQGFQDYDSGTLSLKGTRDHSQAERKADEVAAAVLERLDAPAPFFGFVHFYDPHQPLAPPADLAARFDGSADDLYYAEIAAADRALGRILEGLEERALLEDTLIVVTSDHGEGRGEHGEGSHGSLLHDATQHVPLVFRHPSLSPRRVGDSLASLCDLFPTLVDFVGLPVPPGLDGRSLHPLLQGEASDARPAVYLEAFTPYLTYDFAPLFGVRTMEWKLITGGTVRLHDLARDPLELDNLAEARPEVRDALLRQLAALRERGPALDEAPRTLTGNELELMGGIGYAVGAARAVDAGTSDLPDPYEALGSVRVMEEAMALFEQGNRDQGVRRLEALVAQYPKTLLYRQNLGACYGQVGAHQKALEQFEAVLEQHPESLENLRNAAVAAHQVGAKERAFAFLEQAIALAHCPPKPYFFLLWEAYQQDDRKADAARVMEQLLARRKLPANLRREAQGCLDQSQR